MLTTVFVGVGVDTQLQGVGVALGTDEAVALGVAVRVDVAVAVGVAVGNGEAVAVGVALGSSTYNHWAVTGPQLPSLSRPRT